MWETKAVQILMCISQSMCIMSHPLQTAHKIWDRFESLTSGLATLQPHTETGWLLPSFDLGDRKEVNFKPWNTHTGKVGQCEYTAYIHTKVSCMTTPQHKYTLMQKHTQRWCSKKRDPRKHTHTLNKIIYYHKVVNWTMLTCQSDRTKVSIKTHKTYKEGMAWQSCCDGHTKCHQQQVSMNNYREYRKAPPQL